MPIFDDHERVTERKLEQDDALSFKIRARRNKLLGIWAAEHMGLIGEDAARYAMSIVEAEFTHHDDETTVRKICQDMVARGFPIVDQDVSQRFSEFAAQARAHLAHETGRDPPFIRLRWETALTQDQVARAPRGDRFENRTM
jgi:hypothetical protein